MATGSSNRQTKAWLPARDGVREAGFTKPRIEGEDNGVSGSLWIRAKPWYVMQPQIRRYYNLEEIWATNPCVCAWVRQASKVKLVAPASKTSAKRKAASTSRGAGLPPMPPHQSQSGLKAPQPRPAPNPVKAAPI